MSMWRIIHRDGPIPPGGWPFTDPRTGMAFNGMNFSYAQLMSAIANHRKANPRLYPPSDPQFLDTDFISIEYDRGRCAQLGNDPRYCKDMSAVKESIPANVVTVAPSSACPKCGSLEANPKYCATCSGQRLLGYTCAKCGFYRNK